MIWFPRGLWRYAILILLLLVLAAIASYLTISSFEDFLVAKVRKEPMENLRDAVEIITIPFLSLIMGFLFLSGALGVWAIRSTSQIEGRRRVGRFVDAMDYLSDGLVAVDREGRITGSNPAARELAGCEVKKHADLRELFPCLSPRDAQQLVHPSIAQEVECVARETDGLRAFRFRSQPSEDMNLILVSDVTGQRAEEMRNRQIARLQLIGRIARGVAHDFNNILSAVSGYASLVERQKSIDKASMESLKAIIHESQRGAVLASQLQDLSRTGVKGKPCDQLAEHVEKAAGLLRVGLAVDWEVVTDVQGEFSPVPVTDIQVEQILVNLGLLVADELPNPGFVHIRVRPPSGEPMFDVGDEFAAVVLLAAYGSKTEAGGEFHPEAQTTATEAGVIQSVVRSVLEEVGGRLDSLVAIGGRHSYRVCLPLLVSSDGRMSAMAGIPEELKSYLSTWKVLLAGASWTGKGDFEQRLKDLGMDIHLAGDIVAALQHVEADRDLHAMIFEKKLLGDQADALLKAILKLRPSAGTVLLAEQPESVPESLKSDIVVESVGANPDTLIQALIKARELAGGRKHA